MILVTIFSDASVKDGIFGAAFWAKCKEWTIEGKITGNCRSVEEAELQGILSAIEAVKKKIESFDSVIQCDSLLALGMLVRWGARVAKTSPMKIPLVMGKGKAPSIARDIVRNHKGKVYLKHVKAHTNRDCPRHRLNNKMDRLAKEARVTQLTEVEISKCPVPSLHTPLPP